MSAKLELKEDKQYDGSTPLKRVMQEMFVNSLLQGMSQKKAYQNAGYKSKNPEVQASILIRNDKVKKRLEYRKQQIRAENEDKVSKIRKNLEAVAYNESEKTNDRLKALELLGKTEAMFSDRLIHTPEIPQLSQEQIALLRSHSRLLHTKPVVSLPVEVVGASESDDNESNLPFCPFNKIISEQPLAPEGTGGDYVI